MKTIFSLALLGVGGYAVYKYFQTRKNLSNSIAAQHLVAAAQGSSLDALIADPTDTPTPSSDQQIAAAMFAPYDATVTAGYAPAFGASENQNGGLTPLGPTPILA